MKKFKKTVAACTVVFGVMAANCFTSIPVCAETAVVVDRGICGDNLTWQFYDDGVLSIDGTGDMYDYTTYEGTATPWKDYTSDITTITLSTGITSIGDYAFFSCPLTRRNLVLPNGLVSIGDAAFSNDGSTPSLLSVTIPNSVTTIGADAFGTFADATTFTVYGYSDTIAETYADENGFSFVALCENPPFSSQDKSKTTISGTCGENLTWRLVDGTLYISGEGEMDNYDNFDRKMETVVPGVFTNCEVKNRPWEQYTLDITSIVIEEGVTSIGNFAFVYLPNLESVTFADSVTDIGAYAFLAFDDDTVTFSDLPENLYHVGEGAFMGCDSLISNLTLPESVRIIDAAAFAESGNSSNMIVIPKGVTEISDYAFSSFGKEAGLAYWDFMDAIFYADHDITTYCTTNQNYTVYGYTGTAAEAYANLQGTSFVAMDADNKNAACGDVTLDDVVDLLDAVVLQKYLSNQVTLTDQQLQNANCNAADGSDTIDDRDVGSLMQFLIFTETTLPVTASL
jgi:hypothetical protein